MRRETDHPTAVYVYSAAVIIAGGVAFVWAAQSFPISEAISLTAAGGSEGVLPGLAFWTGIGLLGGMKVQGVHGHAVLTFHLPFIIAAAALGGPTAAAVVALISTLEWREIREAPWYGVAFNHAAYTLAAIAGGLTMLVVRTTLQGFGFADPQPIELASIALGSLVLAVSAAAFAAGTIALRDDLTLVEAIHLFDGGYWLTASAQVLLGWMLWLTYTEVGWWAAIICSAFVLVIWSAHDHRERARYDLLSGLLSRAAFDVRLGEAVASAQRHGRRLALMGIDLDGFKAINDLNGHLVGDGVIKEIGARLRASVRLADAATRRGGDEFGVLLAEVEDDAAALAIAERIYATICQTMDIEGRTVSVGASIGLYVVQPGQVIPSITRLHDLCDKLMYWAKFHGGGIRSNIHQDETRWAAIPDDDPAVA